jgi:hypothetical protein
MGEHSNQKPGKFPNWLAIVFIVALGTLGIGILFNFQFVDVEEPVPAKGTPIKAPLKTISWEAGESHEWELAVTPGRISNQTVRNVLPIVLNTEMNETNCLELGICGKKMWIHVRAKGASGLVSPWASIYYDE